MESEKFGQEFIEEKYPDTADKKRPRLPVTERFERIEKNPRAKERLERLLMDDFVLDVSDEETLLKLARSLYESEKRVAIERGHGGDIGKADLDDAEILDKYKNAILEKEAIQRKTLGSWFNYIKQNDANYPMWFRYYVVRSLRSLGQFSRDEKTYTRRTDDTIAPFPELNAEALAFVHKALVHEFQKENFNPEIVDISLTPEEEQEVRSKVQDESKVDFALKGRLRNKRKDAQKEAVQSFGEQKDEEFVGGLTLNEARKDELTEELVQKLKTKDFAKLYAFAQVECAGNLDRESLEGEWVKYDKGSDYTVLENALKGKGTGWCTAEGSAKGQLENGDFYVYYTKNKAGISTEPRIAIRMQGDSIGEVRGVDPKQELEPDLVETARAKYSEFPGAEKYEKADADMKKMTEIYKKCFSVDKETKEKIYLNPKLSKEELVFLYEIDSEIAYFGYEKDPRIEKVRSMRDPKEDVPIFLDCTPSEIAWKQEDITEATKSYIGPLFPGIFQTNLEHIYTSFPEGKLNKYQIEIGGKSKDELKKELEEKKIKVYPRANELLESKDFTVLKKTETSDLVRLTVKDLGFPTGATTDEIFKRASEYGLELCPPEVGPQLRLSYSGSDWMYIAMKQISGGDGSPDVFLLDRDGGELRLRASDGAKPSRGWSGSHQFVFSLRKRNSATQ